MNLRVEAGNAETAMEYIKLYHLSVGGLVDAQLKATTCYFMRYIYI